MNKRPFCVMCITSIRRIIKYKKPWSVSRIWNKPKPVEWRKGLLLKDLKPKINFRIFMKI